MLNLEATKEGEDENKQYGFHHYRVDNRGRSLLTLGAEALSQLAGCGGGGVKRIKIRAGLHSLVTCL